MADINTIVRRLEKKKNVNENLALFSNHMMAKGNRLSYIRFTLNYPTFYDMIAQIRAEGVQLPQRITDGTCQLNKIVKEYIETALLDRQQEERVSAVDRLREENIHMMKLLTAYADRYTIYEYVLNRIEYQFLDKEPEKSYSDTFFKDRILSFLTADKDSAARQMRTVEILEQLPMRMTKTHFLQILQDGLSAYADSDKQTVDDLLFMIRTAAMMEEPDGMQDFYPDLYEMIHFMAETDFSSLAEEDYQRLLEKLKQGMAALNRDIGLCTLMEELTNDLYVILLSDPYAMTDLGERQLCQMIIESVLEHFRQGDNIEMEDAVLEQFEKLEGIQEVCSEQFQTGEAMLEEIAVSYEALLKELLLDKSYHSLSMMTKLLSPSLYIDLHKKDTGEQPMDQGSMLEISAALSMELKEHLKKQPKCVSRAIMAKVLTLLPMFVRTYQELEDYILTSLSSCSDQAEKLACIEIIETMMKE